MTVEMPAGALAEPTQFYYANIEQDTAPDLPDGYIQTDRVFNLSVLDDMGEKVEGPVTFEEPLQVTVGLVAQYVALAGGDAPASPRALGAADTTWPWLAGTLRR